MKKILQICDTYDWAIGTLAKTIVEGNPHFDWKLLALHPKDLEQGKIDLAPVIEDIKWADVIDAEYWRTLSQLLDKIPELLEKPIYLWHHNEKNLFTYEWPPNVIHCTTTKYAEQAVKERYPHAIVHYVANTFNPNEFSYNPDYPPKEPVVGYVGRIVPWKGLKDVAKACYELGYQLQIMGKMDKPSYYAEIPVEHQDNILWDWFNCPDDARAEYYKNITCYVGNSGSGRETGPLGLIEAMASGVPVVSTHAGIAADIGEDHENMLMVGYDDYEGLKEAIKEVMETPALQARLRKNAWDTIRGYNHERRGMICRNFINQLIYKDELVSIIVPTTRDREKETFQILEALKESTYKIFEVILVFDHEFTEDKYLSDIRRKVNKEYEFVVKVLGTGEMTGYNLAMARNMATIEADGKYLMFNDSRMSPAPTAIEEFLKVMHSRDDDSKVWIFGEKGGEKSTFVENFSMIRRRNFINGGMCNERITMYGGMSQELRARFSSQGYEFGYAKEARATQLCKSSLSPQKKGGIIRMKNLLYKLGLN